MRIPAKEEGRLVSGRGETKKTVGKNFSRVLWKGSLKHILKERREHRITGCRVKLGDRRGGVEKPLTFQMGREESHVCASSRRALRRTREMFEGERGIANQHGI